nr:DUF305 domain-containing protein [Paralcaligenes ureilyticus]
MHAARQVGVGLCLCLASAYASAHGAHHQGPTASAMSTPATAPASPPPFIASTAKPFAELMSDAMAVMDYGMQQAPMNGQSEHDFITMMMPHHQGAVDMARAVLLYTKDPEIRNLALGIITEQQNEIHVMQAWLEHHPNGLGK